MVFQGPAKKISIRFVNGSAGPSAPMCKALLTFLSPKDVCCLQVFDNVNNVEIQFLARPFKTDVLIQTASRIAPDALIQIENTIIVHAQSLSGRDDLAAERAHWELQARC
jgi:hypothetical protein